MGQKPEILIADLDMLKEILVKDFTKFMDRPVSSVLAWSSMLEYLSLLYDKIDVSF